MARMFFGTTLLVILLAAETCFAGGKSVIAPGAKLKKLATTFKFTEGPASDSKGNVYFTDQPNDRILKWGTDGKLSTFLKPAGRSSVSS